LSADDGNDGIAKPRTAAELIAKLTTNAAARIIPATESIVVLSIFKNVLHSLLRILGSKDKCTKCFRRWSISYNSLVLTNKVILRYIV
jgi:hypothetical protein